jgi:hypothetical protein
MQDHHLAIQYGRDYSALHGIPLPAIVVNRSVRFSWSSCCPGKIMAYSDAGHMSLLPEMVKTYSGPALF